jgi:molybdopterin-guanine dinucleotide biosynthesis protein A
MQASRRWHILLWMILTVGILIGGASRRMGRPKALIEIGGEALIERTVRLARSVSDRVVLLGRPPFRLPPSVATLPVLPDARPGIGPLGGLAAMLAEYSDRPALLLACDLPKLERHLLDRLQEKTGADFDAIAFSTGPTPAGWQPCCAIYMPTALPRIESRIDAGEYSMQGLLAALRTKTVPLAEQDAPLLSNLNTPADIEALRE